MTTRRGWRAWLAAAVPVGLAGIATLTFGRAAASSFVPPRDPGGPASTRALAGAPAPARPGLPPGRAGREAAGPGAQPGGVPEGCEPHLLLPAWRTLLEARWQQRLTTVTRLSVAYHDAADRSEGGYHAGDQAGPRQLPRLMREAVAARRALSDTEEALARLSAGTYGWCEQCAAAIAARRLSLEPEARYCERCTRHAAEGSCTQHAAGGTRVPGRAAAFTCSPQRLHPHGAAVSFSGGRYQWKDSDGDQE